MIITKVNNKDIKKFSNGTNNNNNDYTKNKRNKNKFVYFTYNNIIEDNYIHYIYTVTV